jgi:hypothetical protein
MSAQSRSSRIVNRTRSTVTANAMLEAYLVSLTITAVSVIV